jgi:hypothetical protein
MTTWQIVLLNGYHQLRGIIYLDVGLSNERIDPHYDVSIRGDQMKSTVLIYCNNNLRDIMIHHLPNRTQHNL